MIRKLQPMTLNEVRHAFFNQGEQTDSSILADHPVDLSGAVQTSAFWKVLEADPVANLLTTLPNAPVGGAFPAAISAPTSLYVLKGGNVFNVHAAELAVEESSAVPAPGGWKSLPAGWSFNGVATQLLPVAAPGPGVSQAQVDQIHTGLDQVFAPLDAALGVQVFAENLPLVGDNLKAAFDAGDGPLHQLQTLRTAIYSGLDTLHSAASYSTSDVSNVITSALANAGITGAGATVTLNGADVRVNFTTSKTYNTTSPLEASFGLPGVGFQSSGTANTQLGYTFNFGVGVDAAGFYYDTSPTNDLTLSINTTIPALNAQAKLGFLQFTATDNGTTPTTLAGSFGLNFKDPSGDGKLRISELAGTPDLLDANFSGAAGVHLKLNGGFGDAALPDMSTDFNFDWAFSTAPVDPLDTNASFGARPTVSFKNVSLGLGSFFTEFAKPVLDQVRELSEPLQPIIDAIKTPIPLLTQLHELNASVPNTLLELAVANGTVTRAEADQFDVLAKVIEIANSVPATGAENIRIDLGDFNLGAADPRGPLFEMAQQAATVVRNAVTAIQQNPIAAQFLTKVKDVFPVDIPGTNASGQGMKFPILDNPQSAFGLLLGKNVDLFTMDNATQNIALYNINEFIRLIGPLGVRLQGQGNVRLDLDFGFDTRGLTQSLTTGDLGDIINGFYMKVPTNAQGAVISMAELQADFNVSLALNVIIAEAGVGGGLDANVKVSLFDPDGDRRVHFDEFADQLTPNPLDVFDASGIMTYGLNAYVTVGYSEFSHTWDYNIANGVVFDFGQPDGIPGQPVLARIDGATTFLHIGDDAHRRNIGDSDDGSEQFTVTHLSGAAGAEQIGVAFLSPISAAGTQPYGPINGVIKGGGGLQGDRITLAADVVTPALLTGGVGGDFLTGGAGNDTISGGDDRDVLKGGGGVDVISGEAGGDLLEGGSGGDTLDGGDGYDAVSYAGSALNVLIDLQTGQRTNDAVGDMFISIEQFEGSGFDDTLRGTGIAEVFKGNGGPDILDGRGGNDALEGNAGGDQLIGGDGFDFATYWTAPSRVSLNLATGGTLGDANGDTFSSIEGVIGSDYDDNISGDENANRLDGAGGPDTVDGAGGDDYVIAGGAIYTGPNKQPIFDSFGYPIGGVSGDTLSGGSGVDTVDFSGVFLKVGNIPLGVTVDLASGQCLVGAIGYTATNFEKIIGTVYGDSLSGNAADNTFWPLRGGGMISAVTGGPDYIDGRGGNDTLIVDFSTSDTFGGVTLSSSGLSRALTVGSTSVADNFLFSSIEKFVITGTSKNDSLGVGNFNYASLSDTLYGLGGDDFLGGAGGSDTLIGGDGNDTINGQGTSIGPSYGGSVNGQDVFDGGPGDDLIENFALGNFDLPAPISTDSLSQLDGGPGFDTFSVDFSDQTVPIIWNDASPTDLVFASGAYARNFERLKHIVGGSANDSFTSVGRFDNRLHGSGGDDTFAPGLGQDHVEGGPGTDTVVLDFSIGDTAALSGLTNSNGNYLYRTLAADGAVTVDALFYRTIEALHVTGTSKADAILGTDGSDRFIGGAGDDILYGTGNSSITSPDYIDGGEGNDTIRGSYNAAGTGDTLLGGAGDDSFLPRTGSDTIFGGPGNDTLSGGDFPSGGYGNDVWDGGDGDDDVYNVAAGGNLATNTHQGPVRMQLDGGAGFDTLGADFGNQTQAITFIGGQTNSMDFTDGSYFRNFERLSTVVFGSGNDNIVQPGRVNNSIGLGAGDDTINPGLGIDYVEGGPGNDLVILDYTVGDDANVSGVLVEGNNYVRRDLTTNAVIDSIYGPGFERVWHYGGSKADLFYGSPNADILKGNGGNDTIIAGHGDDLVEGGEGVDTIEAGFGNHTIDGGPGNDTVKLDINDTTSRLDKLDGGDGVDTLISWNLDNATTPVVFDSRAPASIELPNGAYARNFEIFRDLRTGSGNDVITQLGRVNNDVRTGNGDDIVRPGLGIDYIDGGGGNDIFFLDYSADDDGTLTGAVQEGGSWVRRSVATNAIVDSITGPNIERVNVIGTTKNDLFIGPNGDDFFDVRRGSDNVDGAGGIDTLKLDWSAMTTGTQGANFSALNLGTGTGTLTTSDAANFKVVFSNFEKFDFTGTGLADTLRGLALSDTLRGDGGDDMLEGGEGADVLDGGDGNDTLYSDSPILGQWASQVIAFTSQFSSTHFAAANMLGVPDTFRVDNPNDSLKVWAAAAPNGTVEQLTLGYASPVLATGVVVRETNGNGFVTRIELLDTNDQFHTVFSGIDPSQPGAVVDFAVSFAQTDYLVKGVKIFVDTNRFISTQREQIDAVQLIGYGARAGTIAEQLTGGAGDDTFIVSSLGASIVENAGGGLDEVRSYVDFDLPANVEKLTLLSAATKGTGSSGNNVIIGNDLANVLDGGAGADSLAGGLGNDRYIVDTIADVIVENAGAGTDVVLALSDYTLGGNVENLELAGRATNGIGNELANLITGNARSNYLQGAEGNDVLLGGFGIGLAGANEVDRLQGGSGADIFVLGNGDSRFYDDHSSLTPGIKGYARIDDFTPSQGDKLRLNGSAADYLLGGSPVAGVAGTAIFYDTNFDGTLDPTHDELISIVDSPEALNLSNLIGGADFV